MKISLKNFNEKEFCCQIISVNDNLELIFNKKERKNIFIEIDNNFLIQEELKLIPIKPGFTIVKIINDAKNTTKYMGLAVTKDDIKHNRPLKVLVENINIVPLCKDITVFSEKKLYNYKFIESVCNYMFEDLNITENIAPSTNRNRTNRISEKKYICIHDTADIDYFAKDWSDTIYNNFYQKNNAEYKVSYHYVVGADGIYHNIPDNEICFHAGDGTNVSFNLIPSGVYGENPLPKIRISNDGYYTIDDKKTTIIAPQKNGEILTENYINKFGIKCKLIDNQYYIGVTWYSETYNKIVNHGGNTNSIGIETCVTKNTDLVLTFHRLAKLTAKLIYDNKLSIEDVVPHHYFSGKNCPATIINNNLWNYIIKLIKCEYEFLKLKNEGYTFAFENISDNLSKSGRVNNNKNSVVKYFITIKKDNIEEKFEFYSYILN